MNYRQAIDYLYSYLPMFQRQGKSAYKADLKNTIALCEALGNPHCKFKSVHIAGTNGKGSSAHLIASILQEAGYKTGLYTSPHLKSFTERIKINGTDVEERFIADFVSRYKGLIEKINPSFFEVTVAMTFDYFAQENVDIAVIEVGLGGRLDSTNVISPCLSLITNISKDHTDILGNTLIEIASEKAGIIKKSTPVVIGTSQPNVNSVFIDKANEIKSEISFADTIFTIQDNKGTADVLSNGEIFMLNLNLPFGSFYKKNLPGVLKAIEILVTAGFKIEKINIKKGIEQVVKNTGLKGRFQQLSKHPRIICDIAHNIAGIKLILKQIESFDYNKLLIIWGMVKDKNIREILSLLPKKATYFLVEPNLPRKLPVDDLFKSTQEARLDASIIGDTNLAIKQAKKIADPDDLIFIGGSTFVVAEINEI